MADEQYLVNRRMKVLKLRRKARRFEIAIRRLFKLFRFCLIIFIFYGIYRVANSHYWYFPQDMFSTGKNVEIIGNSIVSDKRVLSELKKIEIPKKPLYKINPKEMTRTLEKLPPVKRAYIRRFWYPARLVIFVQEVIPAILISPSETAPEVAAFSFDGIFINREYLPLYAKGQAVKVLSYGTKDDDYEKWDKEKINTLYKLAKQIEQYSGERVQYLDLRMPDNAFIQLKSVKIRLGNIDLGVFERIKAIPSMMSSQDVKRLASNTKYIDLSWSQVQYVNVDN